MKSIIFNLLLCLFPFVSFSSTFTSTNNPIVLPTTTITTDDNDNSVLLPEVLDMDGQPLKTDEKYVIYSTLIGGGRIYLTNLGNTTCPKGIVDNFSFTDEDTPVKFFPLQPFNVVREADDINIMFSVPTTKPCVNETVWKVDAPEPGGIRFVVTGGTLGNPGPDTINNWFKIEKFITERPGYQYRLRYCPSNFICPTCPIDCSDLGFIFNRLALTNQLSPFGFRKFKKNDA